MMRVAASCCASAGAVAAAAAAHALWLRGTFASRLDACTQAEQAGLHSGRNISAAALVKNTLEHGAKVVVLSGSGSAEAASALADDQDLAHLRVLLKGSLRQALDVCHLPPTPSSMLAAAVSRLGGRSSLAAALDVAGAASERGGFLLCLTQRQLMEEGVAPWVHDVASTPGCTVCIVADATLYAAEHCEQLAATICVCRSAVGG